ncbi:MAG: hypothetical protein WKF43_02515 [Acidimicrobiales bacterium]
MATRDPADAFRARWVVHAARSMLTGRYVPANAASLIAVIEVDGESVNLAVDSQGMRIGLGDVDAADVRIACGADTAFELLAGGLDLEQARRQRRATVTGDRRARARLVRLLGSSGTG